MRFSAITVGALLDAARIVTRPADIQKDPDQVDSLIHRNADAHMDQPRACVINVADFIADRIKEVLASVAPPVPPADASTDAGSDTGSEGVSTETQEKVDPSGQTDPTGLAEDEPEDEPS